MRNAEILHQTTTIDPERNTIRPKIWTPTEQRRHLIKMRLTAQHIKAGRRVEHSVSPRQIAKYGRQLPTLVGLRFRIGYMRNPEGWQRLRPVTGGYERESWVERKQEMASKNAARRIQRRRAASARRVW